MKQINFFFIILIFSFSNLFAKLFVDIKNEIRKKILIGFLKIFQIYNYSNPNNNKTYKFYN